MRIDKTALKAASLHCFVLSIKILNPIMSLLRMAETPDLAVKGGYVIELPQRV